MQTPKSLFNGHDLEGWSKVGGDATFDVDDDCIVGIHGPGPNTFLRTDDVYSDFDLRKSVSSILIRNFPPIFCAYSQLNSAVRAVPI